MPILPATGASPPSCARLPQPADRLFVPLSSEPFRWFCSGRKHWELRKRGRQYTTEHVRPGRDVELRRGYANPDTALWGEIVAVFEADSIEAFFDEVCWTQVLPESDSLNNAIADARRILSIQDGERAPVLGFKVALEEAQT